MKRDKNFDLNPAQIPFISSSAHSYHLLQHLSLTLFLSASILFNPLFTLSLCGPEQPRIQTEVLGHLLVRSIVCSHCSVLTRSLAPHYSLHLRAPLRSLICLLAHYAHSLAHGKVRDWMAILSVFFFYFGPLCSGAHLTNSPW